MAIDYWKLVKEFEPGDTVQRFVPGLGILSPFTGRVTAVHRGLGVLDVQWPYANERMFPDDVMRVDPRMNMYLPPSFDQSYTSWDTSKQKVASVPGLWRDRELPPGFYQELARVFAKGANEVDAYDELWHRYASIGADDESLRDEVAKFYLVAGNLTNLRIQQHATKTAAYWTSQNRQYRVTQNEIKAKKPACPKCGTAMRKTTYKMEDGVRTRLFACPKDLFLIRVTDMLGPTGEPVGW